MCSFLRFPQRWFDNDVKRSDFLPGTGYRTLFHYPFEPFHARKLERFPVCWNYKGYKTFINCQTCADLYYSLFQSFVQAIIWVSRKYFKPFSHPLILFLSSEYFLQKMISLTITRNFQSQNWQWHFFCIAHMWATFVYLVCCVRFSKLRSWGCHQIINLLESNC